MKKTFYVLLLIIIVLGILLSGCAGSKKLTGCWNKTEGSGFSYLEFFEDGKYVSSHTNYEGNYSVSDNRIMLEGILVDSKTFTYSVSGDVLTFYSGDDDVYAKYERKK